MAAGTKGTHCWGKRAQKGSKECLWGWVGLCPGSHFTNEQLPHLMLTPPPRTILRPDSVEECETWARTTEAEGDSLTHQLCDLEQMTLTFTVLPGKMGTVIPPSQGSCRDKRGRAC